MTVTAVFGVHWGDEGKGKIVDLLVKDYDIVARWNGGNNAGHTVVTGEFGKIALHFLPSGISHKGKINVIGNGEIVNLQSLLDEIKIVENASIKVTPENLVLSERSQLIMPYYTDIEKKQERIFHIGTTGRGIGTTYAKQRERTGLRVIDIFNEDEFKRKVQVHSEEHRLKLDPKKVFEEHLSLIGKLQEHLIIENTVYFFRRHIGANILLEGAQGALLDIDAGTYPYVTSSNPSPGGAYNGCSGIPRIDKAIGVMKAGYVTRVGSGPFPTELGGRKSEDYCDDKNHVLIYELESYGIPFTVENRNNVKYDHHHKRIIELMNSDDAFLKGIGMRLFGEEYGATTGRPRRTGCQDLVATAYSLLFSGNVVNHENISLALTKLDVSDVLPHIDICTGYMIDGVETDLFPSDEITLRRCEPIYEELSGWKEDIRGIKKYSQLPKNARAYVEKLERKLSVRAMLIGTGPDRTEIIKL
jgi:adenylosuccinate synthase